MNSNFGLEIFSLNVLKASNVNLEDLKDFTVRLGFNQIEEKKEAE